jgi:hypothetical protein
MSLYRETTDGSTIEERDTILVWNYEDADPDFGSCQAKELVDHLESVLTNEPVSVKTTSHSVEVKPQVTPLTLVLHHLHLDRHHVLGTNNRGTGNSPRLIIYFLFTGCEQGPGGAANAGIHEGAGTVPGLRAVHR